MQKCHEMALNEYGLENAKYFQMIFSATEYFIEIGLKNYGLEIMMDYHRQIMNKCGENSEIMLLVMN